MSSGLFKNVIYKLCIYKSYMYKEDLVLNNLQGLICHKTKSNLTYLNIVPVVPMNLRWPLTTVIYILLYSTLFS